MRQSGIAALSSYPCIRHLGPFVWRPETPFSIKPHSKPIRYLRYGRSVYHYQLHLEETTAAARAGFRRGGERGLLESLYIARKQLYGDGKLAGTPLAEICVRLGKREEALQLIQSDYANHRAEFLWTLTDANLMAFKSDPRYQELPGKLNFPHPPSASQQIN